MVRHIVIWKLKDEFREELKSSVLRKIGEELENLTHQIDGIVDLKVVTSALPSSSADVMLDSLFRDANALEAYQVHPAHQNVALLIHDVMQSRTCLDYLI
jgi:hypothetical protein